MSFLIPIPNMIEWAELDISTKFEARMFDYIMLYKVKAFEVLSCTAESCVVYL